MNSSLTIAIVCGLTGMFGWGFADFFAKKTIDKIGDMPTLFWGQLIGIAPLLALFLFNLSLPLLGPQDLLYLAVLGVVGGLSYIPLYSAFSKGQVSIISPIFASSSVIVVIFASLFLHTSLTHSQLAALALVIIGVLIVGINPKEIGSSGFLNNKTKGVPDALVAMVSYSFWLLFLNKFLQGKNWIYCLLIIRTISMLTIMIYSVGRKHDLTITDKSIWKYLFFIGVFDVIAFGAVSYGFSHAANISIITVLSATFSIPTIILAYIFLKERVSRTQIFAVALMICGISIISLV